jgi:hypothetical protein
MSASSPLTTPSLSFSSMDISLQMISFFSIPMMIYDQLLVSVQSHQGMKLFGHERSEFCFLLHHPLPPRVSDELKEILRCGSFEDYTNEMLEFEIATNSPHQSSLPDLVTFVESENGVIVFNSQGRYQNLYT